MLKKEGKLMLKNSEAAALPTTIRAAASYHGDSAIFSY